MKTQIRRGVFETNSSSVHSISITKDDFNGSLPSQFTIACNGEFGWEVDDYDSPMDKAAYLYQAIVFYPTYNYHTKKEYENVAKAMLGRIVVVDNVDNAVKTAIKMKIPTEVFFASLFCIKLQKVFVGCCTCIL